MQTWSGPNTSAVSTPARKHITIILSVFSLVGLVIGFAVGGLTHPKASPTGTTNPTQKPTIPVQVTTTPTPTATQPPDIILGPPSFTNYSITESVTSSSPYTVKIQAMDKKKQAVHTADITCKLWLVADIPARLVLDPKTLTNTDNIKNPITGTLEGHPQIQVTEIVDGLTFDPTTPQTAPCDANGQYTWKYSLASTVLPGKYELVILADWKGKHFNWSWADITVK